MANARSADRVRVSVTDIAPRFDTLPDVARRLRRRVTECGGEHFAIFLQTAGSEPRRLMPAMDSDYPGHAAFTAQLVETLGERFFRRPAASTRPLWWTSDPGGGAALSLARCGWALNVPPPGLPGTSVALPLFAEREDDGMIVITGDGMTFTMASLTDFHGFCLHQFALIARLRPNMADAPPQMSPREIECLTLTADGCTSEEIATRLGLSVHTTNQYLTNSSQKLNADGKVHAVAKALRLGLID